MTPAPKKDATVTKSQKRNAAMFLRALYDTMLKSKKDPHQGILPGNLG